MKQSIDLNKMIRSRVLIRSLDRYGREIARQEASNSLTYAAGDMFMNALLRSGPSQVTHLYARFGDISTTSYLNPPGDDLKATTRATFIASSSSVQGGLWVPVLSAPAQNTTDDTRYGGNQATYFFRIPASITTQIPPAVSPSGNFDAASSIIYALGLAVAADAGDRNQDIIITELQAVGWDPDNLLLGDFTAFAVPVGGQMAIDYTVPIEINT